jgi:membrane protein YqaA with SNARE-associated domain
MAGYLIALLWGFAEATLFFIIPDVWISILALQNGTEALIACLYTLAGAMTGGSIMYFTGRVDVQKWNKLLSKIPAIRSRDIQKVQVDLTRSGIKAVLTGPPQGIPYKIYAVNAHSVMSIWAFLLISIPARVIRFIIVAVMTTFLSERFLSAFSMANKIWITLLMWAIFYTVYFIAKRR